MLIDILSDNIAGKVLIYDEKAQLRLTRSKVSRGAFNRTLRQAKRNVVKAMYTLILLGYLGLFDNTTFDPYLEIANKLSKYMQAHQNISDTEITPTDHLSVIKLMREELANTLQELSNQ